MTVAVTATAAAPDVLTEPEWTARRAAHEAAVDALLAPHRARRSRGQAHPVHDFLWTYYSHRPSRLRRWHPGLGTLLAGPGAAELLERPGYVRLPGGVGVGPAGVARRAATVEFVGALLRATASRPARLGCFGLHEWAMVHRGGPQALRHGSVPLRLGQEGTDAVVERSTLRCTHHDAFRFFTPSAAALNDGAPTRAGQVATEQPGCLHVGMDLYKWAFTLEPLVPSELVLRCLRLATDARELDMRASPYDLSAHGYAPVRIETPSGRAEYVAAQSVIAERAVPLRAELLAVCERASTVMEPVCERASTVMGAVCERATAAPAEGGPAEVGAAC